MDEQIIRELLTCLLVLLGLFGLYVLADLIRIMVWPLEDEDEQ